MNNVNVYLVEKLRLAFLTKIKQDWHSKWASHGKDFVLSELKSQNAFYTDLLDDIEESLMAAIGSDAASKILIGKDNLRRIINGDSSSSWQSKTRNSIAYYIGYQGWDDFVRIHEPQPPIRSNQNKEKRKNPTRIPYQNYVWMGLIACLLLFVTGWILKFSFPSPTVLSKNMLFEVQDIAINQYPVVVKLYYSLPARSCKEAKVRIDNELFQFVKYPNEKKLSLTGTSDEILFYTPGIKSISLVVDDKIIKEINVLIPTGKEWYGSARVKIQETPNPFQHDFDNIWYGSFNQSSENTASNFITSPMVWKNYTKNLTNYPNAYLHFPFEPFEPENKKFTRVAFLCAKDFGITIDSLTISFNAKQEEIEPEDCLSFMTQLFDKNLNRFEFYAAKDCRLASSLTFSQRKRFPAANNKNYHEEYLKTEKFRNLFNDHQWHFIEISFYKKQLAIHVDHQLYFRTQYHQNYEPLNEVWFVFEGNGCIDDFKLSNSYTQKILNSDDFSR